MSEFHESLHLTLYSQVDFHAPLPANHHQNSASSPHYIVLTIDYEQLFTMTADFSSASSRKFLFTLHSRILLFGSVLTGGHIPMHHLSGHEIKHSVKSGRLHLSAAARSVMYPFIPLQKPLKPANSAGGFSKRIHDLPWILKSSIPFRVMDLISSL